MPILLFDGFELILKREIFEIKSNAITENLRQQYSSDLNNIENNVTLKLPCVISFSKKFLKISILIQFL